MGLVAAKCTECGANLEVDASKDAAVCPYCGAAFITEKAINNYNISNIEHADIKADKVIVNMHNEPKNLRYKRVKGGWCIYEMNLDVEIPNELHIPTMHKGEPVLYIQTGTFGSANWFDDITVDADNKYISVQDGCVINNETHTLVTTFGEDIVIPNNIITIGKDALVNAKIKEIKIPQSVKNIEANAFNGGPNLKVYIEDLKSWCDIDFENKYSNPLNSYKDQISELYVKGQLVEHLVIPEGVTTIHRNAFNSYLKLKDIVIADSVTSIEEGAFTDCNNISKITYGKGLKSVNPKAFNDHPLVNTYNINEIHLPNAECWVGPTNAFVPNENNPKIYVDGKILTDIVIPEGVTTIKENFFKGLTGIKSISIPSSVISIEKCAFNDCVNLESVTLSNNLERIDEDAFKGCTNLKNITIPNTVSFIGKNAFRNCMNLESVTLSNNLTKIEPDTFAFCKKLKNITIPQNVNFIGEGAFVNCESLQSVNLSDNLNVIAPFAFDCCKMLEEVTLPSKVNEIGEKAFSLCSNLKKINFPDNIRIIPQSAFSHCESLEKVILPENLEEIGIDAFCACFKLRVLYIPYNVKHIRDNAFYACDSLSSVRLGDHASLGSKVFVKSSEKHNEEIPHEKYSQASLLKYKQRLLEGKSGKSHAWLFWIIGIIGLMILLELITK